MQILDYEDAKEIEGGKSAHRLDPYKCSSRMTQIINDYFTHNMSDPIVMNKGTAEQFKIVRGVIGSGSKLMTDSKSENLLYLQTVHEKLKAVDKESIGLATLLYESKSKINNGLKDILILRGVSDLADAEKDKAEKEGYRKIACNNVVHTFANFLKSVSSEWHATL